MNFIGIIPARYGSSRFPGKPLAKLCGMTVIERVYRQVEKQLSNVLVATDDNRIFDEVKSFGGKVVMTSSEHRSGTDRCFEAYLKSTNGTISTNDVIINIQGDEPFIQPTQIEALELCFSDNNTEIATLVKPFTDADSIDDLSNPNSPKVAISEVRNEALYFSRSIIPFVRGENVSEWLKTAKFYKHIGIYAYRADVLQQITQLPQGQLEQTESLEQLRWLENGCRIKVAKCDIQTIGIDTPQDLLKAEKYLDEILQSGTK